MTAIRVLGISGSLRAASNNTKLLRAAAGLAGEGVRLHLWDDLRLVPPFSEDDEREPARPVQALRLAIAGADALLIATPEYNGSIPGQLKNAVDWVSRPYGDAVLTGKPVAVVGASPSPSGAAGAQAELRKVLGRAGARVLDGELSIARAHEAFGPDAALRDPELSRALSAVLDDLQQAGSTTSIQVAAHG
ncbi:MAG: NADPH-dependent FMN reductase [Pseudonocardiaceae bacterium]